MTNSDHYMLPRDSLETQRLDAGHQFFRALYDERLIHPSIPTEHIQRVADVGTGTGSWLCDVAGSLAESASDTHVGFDISSEQFPSAKSCPKNCEFVVHDMTKPFPETYREKFDLVHLRFMSYGLKEADLLATIQNVASLVKPGRYIQWQEIDIIDCWATPSTENVRSAVKSIVREKSDRGFILSAPNKILEAMLSLKVADARIDDGSIRATTDAFINPVSWTDRLLRIRAVDTVSTRGHSHPLVQKSKEAIGIAINTKLLRSGAERKRGLISQTETSSDQHKALDEESRELEDLALGIERDYEAKAYSMDADSVRIVARKALLISSTEDWMTANYQ